VELYQAFEDSVLVDIARRLGNLSFAAAAWQVQRLSESGLLYKDILKRLAVLTGQSEKVLREIFKQAGVKAIAFDDRIYKAAGLSPAPLSLSPAMLQTLIAGINKTQGAINNLTMSTAIAGQQQFIEASNLAYMQVSSGAMDYNRAIRQAVKNVAAQGLHVIQFKKGHDLLDVAARRTVLTGVSQTANQLQIQRADEMGADLVAVSAHIGARNHGVGPMNHASWQGKVYSRSGTSQKYGNFVEITGYGTGEGLGGWNCRHSFYPFFEGVSEQVYGKATLQDYADKKVAYNGKEISIYDATQKQREIERAIRYFKRQAMALEAAKLDSTSERAKVSFYQGMMRDFIKQTKLDRQYVREQVIT
jgi:hypothetical protein